MHRVESGFGVKRHANARLIATAENLFELNR